MADFPRGTLWNVPLLRERYSPAFLASVIIHIGLGVVFIMAPYLLPKPKPLILGSGPGGGSGGETYTVGIADELGGGAGMVKPSPVPQPPPLPAETEKEEVKPEAVPLPQTVEPPKATTPKPEEKVSHPAPKQKSTPPTANVIPTAPQPGAGKTGGAREGAGHGPGSSGVGVSVGPGTGGLGDFWYARVVETRIGSNWIKPQVPGRVEIVYSFFIANDGRIQDIKKEKSSGNDLLDLTAERAIRACNSPSNPLPPLPPQLRGRPVQFVAQFIYPP
jgi:hypothetical protein